MSPVPIFGLFEGSMPSDIKLTEQQPTETAVPKGCRVDRHTTDDQTDSKG